MAELGQCSQRVSGEGQWGAFHQHQCSRKGVVVREGKAYCKVHDPEVIKSYAAFCEKVARERIATILARTAVNQCHAINPANPMAVAESIKEMYEALRKIASCKGLAPGDCVDIAQKVLAKANRVAGQDKKG